MPPRTAKRNNGGSPSGIQYQCQIGAKQITAASDITTKKHPHVRQSILHVIRMLYIIVR